MQLAATATLPDRLTKTNKKSSDKAKKDTVHTSIMGRFNHFL